MAPPSHLDRPLDSAAPLLHDKSDEDAVDIDGCLNDASPKASPFSALQELEHGDYFEAEDRGPRKSFWIRAFMSLRRRRGGRPRQAGGNGAIRLPFNCQEEERDEQKKHMAKTGRRRCKPKTIILRTIIIILCCSGLLHLVSTSATLFLPNPPDPFYETWDRLQAARTTAMTSTTSSNTTNDALTAFLTNLTQNVTPLPCHSHNDYWRRIPLYDALRWGCASVEADVWYHNDEETNSEELYVGHRERDTSPSKTLRSMYIDPLVQLLDHLQTTTTTTTTTSGKQPPNPPAIFPAHPSHTLTLLIDFKNAPTPTFSLLLKHLTPLLRSKPGYLTYYDPATSTLVRGAITVVATGDVRPEDLLLSSSSSDAHPYIPIFYDTPLASLPSLPSSSSTSTSTSTPTPSTSPPPSFLSSTSFARSISRPLLHFGYISSSSLHLLRTHIRSAYERGMRARYWGTPSWPRGLREGVWRVILEEGAGVVREVEEGERECVEREGGEEETGVMLSGDDLAGMVGVLRERGVGVGSKRGDCKGERLFLG